MKRKQHRILVRNKTQYPDDEVRRLVIDTLKDLEVTNVQVNVRYATGGRHWGGLYREYWYPSKGESRPVISVRIPRPEVEEIHDYQPYERKNGGKSFPLKTWQDALVAITAHEGMHHRQTPRNGYGRTQHRGRYVEVECDLAAYRAVARRAK